MSADNCKRSECPECGPSCPFRDEVIDLRQKVECLQTLARTDALTGLFNYRHFSESLNNEMERVRRTGQPMALVIGDIDHFKRFNDTHGHELGNEALKLAAACIDRSLRKLDIACRYGGEEFAVILPGTNARQAQRIAERVREAIENQELSVSETETLNVTMSLGAAVFSSDRACTPEQLVAIADRQLYQAKKNGRNRTCVEQPERTAVAPVTQEEKSALFAILHSDTKPDIEE